jgi:hypothetical protein
MILLALPFFAGLAVQTGFSLYFLYCLAIQPRSWAAASGWVWLCVCAVPCVWQIVWWALRFQFGRASHYEFAWSCFLVLACVVLRPLIRSSSPSIEGWLYRISFAGSATICLGYVIATLIENLAIGTLILALFPFASGVNYLLLYLVLRQGDCEEETAL